MTLDTLRGTSLLQQGKDHRSALEVDAFPCDSRYDVLVRRRCVTGEPEALIHHKLEMVAYLAKTENLLQDADVVLHDLVLIR